MLALDRPVCFQAPGPGEHGVAPPSPSRGPNAELLHFIRDPLVYLTRFYNGGSPAPSSERDEATATAHAQELEGGEPAVETPTPSRLESSPFRLHENAESCRSSLRAGTASILFQQHTERGVHFVNLPVGVHLLIFSFLDAPSLCCLSSCSRYLHSLTSDPLLWTRMLQRDIHLWSVVGHLSHPKVYQDASSDLTPKQIYCRCCQHRNSLPLHASFARPLAGKLRSLMRRIQGHIPRILMFGSGLESVPLVRTLFWEDASPYRPVGLYPGKEGMGSGVCIEHRGNPLNLITLYTATRAERLAAAKGNGNRVNKLVSAYSEEGGAGGAELTEVVQELCQQSDGLVLVVDPSRLGDSERELDLTLMRAMLRVRSMGTPLLVLSVQLSSPSTPSPSTLSPALVAERLDLCRLSQPWQVRSLILETCAGIQDGFDWLLGTAASS